MPVRRARHEEALDLVVPLLHDVRRAGAWPQAWTTLRIVAELLTARDRREDAVFLLAAADAAREWRIGDVLNQWVDNARSATYHRIQPRG